MKQKIYASNRRKIEARRVIQSRRISNDEALENDLRTDGRRKSSDRRLQIHDIILVTDKSLDELEQHLDKLCVDYWSAVALEPAHSTASARYQIQFLSQKDFDAVLQNETGA